MAEAKYAGYLNAKTGLFAIIVIGGIILYKKIFGKDKGSEKLRNFFKKYVSQDFADKVATTGGSKYPSDYLSSSSLGVKWAKEIYDSKGFFNDDEDSLYSAFRDIPTKMEILLVSKIFQNQYGRDVLSYVEDFTNADEQDKIFDIVKDKPDYKKYSGRTSHDKTPRKK